MFTHIEQPLFNKDYFGRINSYRVVLPEYVDVYTQKLIAWLHHHRPEQRWLAAHQLAVLGHPQAIEYLLAALTDPHWLVRLHAAKDLGRLADPRAIEPLINHATDENHSVRRRIAQALANFTYDERVLPVVVTYLSDPDKIVRYWAVESLRQIKTQEVIPLLVNAIRDESYDTVLLATDALIAYGLAAIDALLPPLLPLLAADNKWVQYEAINVLFNIGGEQAENALQSLLQHPDEHIRQYAAAALKRMAWNTEYHRSLIGDKAGQS